jgi:all-trans-retinol 13,14-reductase
VASDQGWDVIVIGSGIGGLAAASLLSTLAGKRVLVLERHFKAGGFTHTFHRKQWCFDVGLHYVGEMAEGCQARQLFDLASGGQLQWTKMPPRFERFVYPGFTFDVPDDPAEYESALGAAFPSEHAGIRRWFRLLRKGASWAKRRMAGSLFPRPLSALLEAPGRANALRLTRDVVSATLTDPLLRAVATAQWGDYGLPPSESAFATHALVAEHYFGGGFFPRGGSGEIPRTFLAQIEAAGGECRLNCEVDEILQERGRVAGVRAIIRRGSRETVEELRAPVVISDAGAAATYAKLLRSPEAAPRISGPITSAVTLYLGLSRSPAEMGFRGENHWLNEVVDPEQAFASRWDVLHGRAASGYLSFPSLKDPLATHHTAEVITLVDADAFAPWQSQPWMRRGPDYQALKERISSALLDLVERHYPGFRGLVAFHELSTPLSVEHFTGHAGGRIYGAPATPERLRDRRYGVRTPIRGLFLAGADAAGLGILGAFMGGTFAAAAALGATGMPRIFSAATKGPPARRAPVPRLLSTEPERG